MKTPGYTRSQLLSLEACTNCQLCAEVCPAVRASNDGQLSGVWRIEELRKLLRKRFGLLPRLLGKNKLSDEELAKFGQTVYRCTLCANCQQVCPVGIGLKDIWLALREDLHELEAHPEKVNLIAENLASSHNVFDEENDERTDWVEDMDDEPDDGLVRDEAEVVYFTGCVAAFYPMAQEIPVALAEVLTEADVDFTLLGEEEWCCGFPLLGAGMPKLAGEIIEHNIEAVREKGAKEVVFACPSCYQMWREHYPAEFKLSHATQFLARLVEEGRLDLEPLNMKVTYHDPCDLGRGGHEYEAPRRVIRAIPGVELVEMEHNRENCRCCGGGGNLEMIDADLSGEISRLKIEEALATGADAIISSCQQCLRTMATYTRRNKVPLKVMDVTQLLRQALDI